LWREAEGVQQGYRAAAIKSAMLTLGAVGLSLWRAVVWPIRAARDSLKDNSSPTMAARAAQIMMTRILTRYRAQAFVFMPRI
jgi:hypothetical protein